jgi:AcrR family transcriptional regulator
MDHSSDQGRIGRRIVRRTVRGVASKKDTQFDPVRTLGLLWRVSEKPSRTGLSVDSIVRAAIEIADAEGLDAVSMRRVADRLGVGAMSLYTHVPGRTDLTDLMTDSALGSLYSGIDEPTASTTGWQQGLRFVAERNWQLYRTHPWLLDAQGARAVLGPHTNDKYEAELRVIDGIGLTDVEMDSVLTLVLTHVAGTARALARFNRVREESGMTDVQWWEGHGSQQVSGVVTGRNRGIRVVRRGERSGTRVPIRRRAHSRRCGGARRASAATLTAFTRFRSVKAEERPDRYAAGSARPRVPGLRVGRPSTLP